MPHMLILGATSEIARACALHFAQEGWDLCLAGRRMDALHALAQELHAKTGCAVDCAEFDALNTSTPAKLWASLADRTDAVLCAVGLLGDQMAARHDKDAADAILRANFTGLVPLLSMAADTFEQRQRGLIIGISSVAGDRGRGSNYLYGSAKAGFTARRSEFVDAPVIEELPMALECELVSYDIESNHMVGRIVNVSVDESVLDEDGKVDADLLQPIVYDPVRLEYRALGEKVGNAFSDGKKLA